MPVQFSVLASGSKGNATLVRAGGSALLIDVGLGPRELGERLRAVGSGWERLAAVVLTHTHGDHVDDASLRRMADLGIPLICHEGHRDGLARREGFRALEQAGRLRTYDDRPFLAPCGMHVEPVELSHDGGPTFGFRIAARDGRRGRPVALGYLADTGRWDDRMAEAMTDVDLLAVEFNHDVDLQRSSGRPWRLIRRNLGDGGHLSNAQGAELLTAVLARSAPSALRTAVLLHLSDQCNLPALALQAARGAAKRCGRRVVVHAALQSCAFPDLTVAAHRRVRRVVSAFPWEAGPVESLVAPLAASPLPDPPTS